jgi:hypothetical protein
MPVVDVREGSDDDLERIFGPGRIAFGVPVLPLQDDDGREDDGDGKVADGD